jgi:hypothetical protein
MLVDKIIIAPHPHKIDEDGGRHYLMTSTQARPTWLANTVANWLESLSSGIHDYPRHHEHIGARRSAAIFEANGLARDRGPRAQKKPSDG